jgi:hypothetical protein
VIAERQAPVAKGQVIGPAAGLLAQMADVDHRRAERRLEQWQLGALVAVAKIDLVSESGHLWPPVAIESNLILHRTICQS